MIIFKRLSFSLIYFLVFIKSEARTLPEKQHGQKVVKSGYGRELVPLPPTPESATPIDQERLKRHAHLPPPAPKHGPKIDQLTSSRHGRESSELLVTVTSNVVSENELLILLPSTSSDNQERFGNPGLPPPAPKPADEQSQIIVTSSNCQDHEYINSNNYGREEKIVSPPTPKPADEEGQIIITSSNTTTNTNDDQNSNYIRREEPKPTPPPPHHDGPIINSAKDLKPHKYPISSLPLQASY